MLKFVQVVPRATSKFLEEISSMLLMAVRYFIINHFIFICVRLKIYLKLLILMSGPVIKVYPVFLNFLHRVFMLILLCVLYFKSYSAIPVFYMLENEECVINISMFMLQCD